MSTVLFSGTRIDFKHVLHGDNYEFHRCGTCGIVWGLPEWFLNERRKDGVGWKCPNGHSFVYNDGKSEKQLLEEKLAAAHSNLKNARDMLATERAHHDQARASLRTTKGVVTKQRKKLAKVTAGVCPVDGCHRHFENLERHITTKHPDYARPS